MNIFIDTISSLASIILFNEKREILDQHTWNIKGNESSTLIPEIDKLIKKNNYDYQNIENIVIVNGPGSFTGVRTSVLAANSINYIINKKITPLSYFDMFNNYPIVKSSSKRDCFVQLSDKSKVEIIENELLINTLKQKNIDKVYGEAKKELFEDIELLENIDYLSIINKVEFKDYKQIEALYIKKPNIS